MDTVENDQDLIEQAVEQTEAQAASQEPSLEPEWEPPSWSKSWKEEARNGLTTIYKNAIAANPDLKSHWEKLQGELDNTYSYSGRRDREFADYRKRADPLLSLVERYEPRLNISGLSFDQGVNQLFAIAEYLGQNPDQALPYLGSTYRPSDPAGTLRALAKAWGSDLSQLGQDEPYIDPTVQGLVSPIAQRLNRIEQWFQQTDLDRTERARSEVASRLQAFEEEKDASGNPKYPYFREVFESHMLPAIRSGFARDLGDAYEFAMRNHPELSKKHAEQLTEAARREALKKTTARNLQTEQAKKSGKSIEGKHGTPSNQNSFEEALTEYLSMT